MKPPTPWPCGRALSAALLLAIALLSKFQFEQQTVHCQPSTPSQFCEKFAVPYGYMCAEHTTETEDGYVLVVHHFSNPRRPIPKPASVQPGNTASNDEPPSSAPPSWDSTARQPFETVGHFTGKSNLPQRTASTVETYQLAADQPSSHAAESAHGNRTRRFRGLHRVRAAVADVGPGPSALTSKSSRDFLPWTIGDVNHNSPIATGHGSIDGSLWSDSAFPAIEERSKSSVPARASPTFSRRHYGHHWNPQTPTVANNPSSMSTELLKSTTGSSPPSSTHRNIQTKIPNIPPEPPAPITDESSQATLLSPVLLMHPEFLNGDCWFEYTDRDSDQLLPFLLLDAGFDVWIGHQRATYWGHEHLTLTPNDQRFWDWSWDEHAKYDMPALLALVKERTGSAVHFVGMSQSATAGAATATLPLVSHLLLSLTLVGPTIYRGNTDPFVRDAWAFVFGGSINSIYSRTGFRRGAFNFSSEFRFNTIYTQGPMADVLRYISGPNCCLGSVVINFSNGWDGTTPYRNLLHYQQGIRTNMWRKFDYGTPWNNSIAYGMATPPNYLPEDIPSSLPVLVIYGGRDSMATPGGPRHFMLQLKGLSKSAVFLPAYAHFDLLYSVNRTQDVFIPVLQFLEKQPPAQFLL